MSAPFQSYSNNSNSEHDLHSLIAIVQQNSSIALSIWAYDYKNQSHLIPKNHYYIKAYDLNNNFISNSSDDPSKSKFTTTIPLGSVSPGIYEFVIIAKSGFTLNTEHANFSAYFWCLPYINFRCGDTNIIYFSFWNSGFQSITRIQFDVPSEVTDVKWQLSSDRSSGIEEVEMKYDIDDEHQQIANKNGTLELHHVNEGEIQILEVSKFIFPGDNMMNKWDTTINLTLICSYNPNHDFLQHQEKLESIFEISLLILGFVCITIGVMGFIDARCLRINDFYRIGAIFAATVQILDMLSDSFLAFDIHLQDKMYPDDVAYDIMLYVCILCIALSSLLSLFQVYYFSKHIWFYNDKAREWLIKYAKLLYITSVFTGSSFTAIDIMNSNIFGLSYFEMGLSNKQIAAFKTRRIYSVVLLEVKMHALKNKKKKQN